MNGVPDNAVESAKHFKMYYDMVTFGFFCGTTPKLGTKCQSHTELYQARKFDPVLTTVSMTEAIDIACSNSQYP